MKNVILAVVASFAVSGVGTAQFTEPKNGGTGGTTPAKGSPPPYCMTNGDLTACLRGNEAVPSFINGINSLVNNEDAPGVNAYDLNRAGADWEHIISGAEDTRNRFEPRTGAYTLSVVDGQTIQLTRLAADDAWGVGETSTFKMVAPHAIDLTARFTVQDASVFAPYGYALMFFADYMAAVPDLSLHFLGQTGPGQPESWITTDAPPGSPCWSQGGNFRHVAAAALPYAANHSTCYNVASYEWPRYTKPFYYGLSSNGMVYEVMFDKGYSAEDQMRLTLFKFLIKLGQPLRPAWDWQYVINQVVSGQEYGYRARIVWKQFVSADDVLSDYQTWIASLLP